MLCCVLYVCSETLRLFPSIPKDPKLALAADTLPDGTRVPRGAQVLYVPWCQGRSQEVWGSDARRFEPDRFLDADHTHFVTPDPFRWPAFQAGPRLCLGKPMALLEVRCTHRALRNTRNTPHIMCHQSKMVIAMLLRHFSLRLVPGQKVKFCVWGVVDAFGPAATG